MNETFRSATTIVEPAFCPAANTPGREVAFLIHQLDQQIRAHLDCRVAEFDLTGPQAMLVQLLDSPTPMNQVAGKLRCDPSNVTGIVDRLEARGLVERQVLPSDRRVKQLVLTADGERVRECLTNVFETIPGLSDLPGADLQALLELLQRATSPAPSPPVAT